MKLGEGPTIISNYDNKEEIDRFDQKLWFDFRFNSRSSEVIIDEKKFYPSTNEDWSNTPKEVWNINEGSYYPKWHIDQSIFQQVENMWT